MIAIETTCRACGKTIQQRGTPRTQVYCNQVCKQRDYRTRKAEAQHTPSNQESQTREITELLDRARLESRFMVLGEKLQYRALLLHGVLGGVGYWQDFMAQSDTETLLKAIAAAEAFYEALTAPHLEQQKRISQLEQEVQRLRSLLDADTLYRMDTKERHFQAWLKKQGTYPQESFQARLLADKTVPQRASRAMYERTLKRLGYDMEAFRDLWIVMMRQS